MDNKVAACEEVSQELARESLISISYCLPDKVPNSEIVPQAVKVEEKLMVINGDGDEKNVHSTLAYYFDNSGFLELFLSFLGDYLTDLHELASMQRRAFPRVSGDDCQQIKIVNATMMPHFIAYMHACKTRLERTFVKQPSRVGLLYKCCTLAMENFSSLFLPETIQGCRTCEGGRTVFVEPIFWNHENWWFKNGFSSMMKNTELYLCTMSISRMPSKHHWMNEQEENSQLSY
ncbi:hypothetical protein OIU79_010623 [Salix purpurea]|uniref:Uncharacterized protein n=1 Tax=Salix purpurea TaxID=77065 RepID=A0A9Q0QG85_SALPP|nr:hypothetical protein OIU79_010623 [Salix purpurea]